MRSVSLLVAIAAAALGALMFSGKPFADARVSEIAYSVVSVGAGLALLAGALAARGRSRLAWSLIGGGVLCWGIGEVVWQVQASALGEIPYPGPADFFYVAGYPLIFAGVVLLPYLRPGRFERIRLAIDATAGTLSLVVVMWVVYLNTVVSLGSDTLETFLGLVYPFGDVLLATALMVLGMRRSEHRLDVRVLLLAGAVALTTVADVVFSLQVAADTYVESSWLDGLWLLSYSAFALTAGLAAKPAPPSESSYREIGGWQLLAPYSAVLALFILQLWTGSGNQMLLNLATTAVAALVVVRQSIAIRERKELLGQQRDDLVASVSHELRTPLTGIQGYAALLADSWEMLSPDERAEMLGTINTQANHLGHIVSDLIDVARDRLQNVKLTRVDYDAGDLVREAVAAGGGGERISVEADAGARVWAEPDRIRQVLVNLTSNAVRYGGSEILVTAIRKGRVVCFAVHDNGDGVPARFQAAMWDRFERGFHQENSSVAGSGIGLSVARDLVIAHGGTIGYRISDLLGGACFEFTIPVPESIEPGEVGARDGRVEAA